MNEEITTETQRAQRGTELLLAEFDDALMNFNPFLWFGIGYTRPTDWMVHIWDRRGGANKKIITTQETSRDEACMDAFNQLRALRDSVVKKV